jgi:hypothetical protein
MGNDLTPDDGTKIIYITLIAPDQIHRHFSGEIKIVNTEDPNEYETIVVSLSTSKNKSINTPFLEFLENHPRMVLLIRQILGL